MKINLEKRDDREKYVLPYHWMIEPFSVFDAHYTTYSNQLISLLPNPPLEILDIGCGDGKIASILVKKGYSVKGIEFSENAISFAKILVPEADFLVADITDPKIVENSEFIKRSFDVVILNAVLEHIHPSKQSQILGLIHNLLKDTGFIVLSVPTPRIKASPCHYNHFEMKDIQQLLEINGFIIDKVIFSHNMSHIISKLMFSSWIKLLDNRWYDLRFIRRMIVRNFKKNSAEAMTHKQAGMLVIRSRKNNVYVT